MQLTFLGTGTSQGVPVIGCDCAVCCSPDARDRRLRTSAMVEVGTKRFIIDAGPDFREQMLREGVSHITAILLTHKHKDHIGGLDDVRALNFVDYPDEIHTVHIYGTHDTCDCVRKDYDYAFAENPYRGVPQIELHEFGAEPFEIEGVEIIPISGEHSRFEVTGFRFGRLAYLTDFKSIAEEELQKLQGVEVLVINALRFEPHDSHLSVNEALEVVERVAPKRAYFTHMSHDIGLHCVANLRLPEGVEFAYDGLKIRV
ncbi:MAG: MBL fold metallo-hydrolase [Rikenellaceae bacterium]|nr:MBL fold metallo-hydrolase [Rikenellaceae bacterium]